jgi:hypothetical protein
MDDKANQEGTVQEDAERQKAASHRKAEHFAERARYAYLFHLWAEPRRDGNQPLWRFSLEEVETGVRHGFGNWDALIAFLQQRMALE